MPNFTIIAADGTWVVRADGAVIGESTRAVRVVRERSTSPATTSAGAPRPVPSGSPA
jgi:hypothetical protein